MLKIENVVRLDLGVKAENMSRAIEIDCNLWKEQYPNGNINIYHQRPGETSMDVTGATYDNETGVLRWELTQTDTFIDGFGQAEIRLVEDNVVKKTAKIVTLIHPSVVDTNGGVIESNQQAYLNAAASIFGSTQQEAIDAHAYAMDSEAWAKGTRDGSAVPFTDETFENNAKYYAEQAHLRAETARTYATTAVSYGTTAAQSASQATASATAAEASKTAASNYSISAAGNASNAYQAKLDAQSAASNASSMASSATSQASRAISAAGRASNSENHASSSAEEAAASAAAAASCVTAAEAARDAAQAAAGDFQGLSATASGLPAGSQPNIEVTHSEGGLYQFAFGIPKGDKGDKGDTGDPAPTAQVTAAVEDWLEENMSSPDSPPLDRSLNLSSAAAPADLVGSLKSAISSITEQHISINLYDKNTCNPADNKSYWNGVLSDNTSYATTGKIPVEAETQYIFSAGSLRAIYVEYFSGESGETFLSRENLFGAAFTTPASCTYAAIMFFAETHTAEQYNAAIAVAQLEKGSTIHDYEPYGDYTYVPFSSIENGEDLSNLANAIESATASDEGKSIVVKKVENGKVTEWEFGETGGGSVEDIVNDISAEKASTNLYDKDACNPEDGHMYWNGGYSAGANYATTGKIPVEAETQYIFYAGGKTVLYCEYFSGTSGDTFISRETLNGSAFVTPENCTYVAIMLFGSSHTTADYNAAIDAGQFNLGSTVLPYEPFGATYYVPLDAVENGNKLLGISTIPESQSQINLYDKTLAVNGKYLLNGTSEISNADWAHTGKIPVKPNTQYNISRAIDSSLEFVTAVFAYDSAGAYLRTELLGNYIYSTLLSFTTESDVRFIAVNMTLASHTEQDFNDTIDTIMLCYGTQRPKTYSAYEAEPVIPHNKLDDSYVANRDCFTGKKWLAIGTSITWYDSKAYQAGVNTGELCMGYVGNVARRKHLLVNNEGISGATLGDVSDASLINRYTTLDWENTDIATIEFGVNDLGNNVAVGTSEDAAGDATFAACLKTVIEYALSENPQICLVICTEPDVRGTNTNNNGNTLKDYTDVTIAIAKQYRLPICDWYYQSGINALNKGDTTKDWMTADGTHPNDAGHMRMGAMLNQVFNSLIC